MGKPKYLPVSLYGDFSNLEDDLVESLWWRWGGKGLEAVKSRLALLAAAVAQDGGSSKRVKRSTNAQNIDERGTCAGKYEPGHAWFRQYEVQVLAEYLKNVGFGLFH